LKELQKQFQQANHRLSVLNDISKIVNSRLSLDNMLNGIIERIVGTLEVDSARVYLVDDGGKTLNLVAHKGLSKHFTGQPHIRTRKAGDGLLGKTLATAETIVVASQSASICPYADQLTAEGVQSTLYMPIATKGSPAGVLCISRFTARRFSSELVDFLDAVGNYIGVAVDNAIMVSHTKKAYQDLKDAQEQIVWTEKLASLGKLAATIAHEINNPLAGVLNYIRLMIKQIKRNHISRETLENMAQYLNTIESEIARCGNIVKDLLAFARRTSISIETNSIEDIVDKTLNLISHDLELKNIQLRKIIEPNLPKIKCDFKQIQQVLLNLMVNASDAMEKAGILTITVSAIKGVEPFIEVTVSDTGTGIAQKDKDKIFDPFFTTKEEGKGVGLGLSVAYGIIAKHNGTIAVESIPGKGSTFKVRLPCA
jgi:two-component system NtrC family sensor kinase